MDEFKTAADYEYERYEILKGYRPENDIPDADLLPHDTRITQGISEENGPVHIASSDNNQWEELQDVPDADEIEMNTPIDPVAPDIEALHGTDLLNGYSGDDTNS